MANALPLSDHLSTDELRQRLRTASDARMRARYEVIYLKALGHATPEIARITAYRPNWVRALIHRYNEHGEAGLTDGRRRNAGREPLLPAGLRGELEAALREPAPDGGLWDGVKVAAWVAHRTGREAVARQRGWDYLRRLGYTSQSPRPAHEKADRAAQEAFKKS